MSETWSKTPPTAEEVRARDPQGAQFAGSRAWIWCRHNSGAEWRPIEVRAFAWRDDVEWSNGFQWFPIVGQYALVGEFGGWCATPDEVDARDAEIATLRARVEAMGAALTIAVKIVEQFGSLTKLMRASIADLVGGIDPAKALNQAASG